jgi:hypothetical protein
VRLWPVTAQKTSEEDPAVEPYIHRDFHTQTQDSTGPDLSFTLREHSPELLRVNAPDDSDVLMLFN